MLSVHFIEITKFDSQFSDHFWCNGKSTTWFQHGPIFLPRPTLAKPTNGFFLWRHFYPLTSYNLKLCNLTGDDQPQPPASIRWIKFHHHARNLFVSDLKLGLILYFRSRNQYNELLSKTLFEELPKMMSCFISMTIKFNVKTADFASESFIIQLP